MQTKQTNANIREIRIKARELFEVKGLPQKQIAETVGISEKTITIWKEKYSWNKNSQKTVERTKAKQLIVILGYNQKDTANMVGVSEKTIHDWILKYKWHIARERHLKNISDISTFIDGFKVYIRLRHQPFYEGISSLLENYHVNVFLKQQEEML